MKADQMSTGLQQRVSTRLAFLAAGMAMSAWAPLVPFAQARTGVEPGQLGLLLLCLGIGSLLAMPVTGVLAARFGCRRIILLSGLGCCLVFPFLAMAPTAWSLALVLFLFGAAIGTLDVAMNIQAIIVAGFVLIGLGASNIVPILFTAASARLGTAKAGN